MIVTKNAAELCTLLLGEIYGQLPSRIFSTLLAKGRSTVAQLSHHTALNQRQVRHGLAVLIRQNAIFHLADTDSSTAHYEANPDVAYNLVRTGKILEIISDKYGPLAKALALHVLASGHINMTELVEGVKKQKHSAQNGNANGNHGDDEHADTGANGNEFTTSEEDDAQRLEDIHLTLARLIADGILEPLTPLMFQSPQDLKAAIEQELLKNEFSGGIRGTRAKRDFENAAADRVKEFHNNRANLKRRLEAEFDHEDSVKRRKLLNGTTAANGDSGSGAKAVLLDERDLTLRLNYDKCVVELRNTRLAQYVDDLIGPTTAKVYAAMLTTLSKKIHRCQIDPLTKTEEDEADAFTGPSVTTFEIFENLDAALDVSSGIGAPDAGLVDYQQAEKIRRFPPRPKESVLQASLEAGDEIMGSDDEDYDRSDEIGFGANGTHEGANGSKQKHSQSTKDSDPGAEDGATVRAQRTRQMRQHLLLLADSKQGFIRHCGSRDRGEWTVDFEHLIKHLRLLEVDILIETSFGRKGLRLVNILKEQGKLDDKTLPTLALVRKADVHVKMAEMEMAGFLDVQEVPRDNARAASRTVFLWFFDEERTLKRVLDNTYKSMVRCIQRLDVERAKKKNVLAVTERKDVQGMEEAKLRGDVYSEYRQFLDIESKLLGQVSKLDDLVGVLRDF